MKKNSILSMIFAIFISLIFAGCSSESSEGNSTLEKTLVDDLINENYLVITGEFSDDAPKHTLAKLKGNKKRGEIYTDLSPEPELSYELEFVEEKKTWYLGTSVNEGSPSYLALYKDCAEKGKCVFFGKDVDTGRILRTFIPMPAGYEHIIKAQNLVAEGASGELIAKNCQEAIKKATAENSGYSRFVKIKAARLLLEETSEYLLARTLFKELGMKGKMAEAEIMFIAKGPAVAAEDIHGTANLAWESIVHDELYDTAKTYEHGEAIAYACAKVGAFEKAYGFAGKVLGAAQRNAAENKKKGIYLDLNRMNNVSIGYKKKLMPEVFQASIINNTAQN